MIIFLILVALISANAFYVSAEFAAVTVRKSLISRLADEGRRAARLLLPVVEDTALLDRYVAACQIGITLSSLILGAFGQAALTPRLAPRLEEWANMQEVAAFSTAAVVVLLALTTAQVILGELVPKSVALQYPVGAALYTAVPMRWSLAVFSWFIWLLNGSGLLILRLLGSAPDRHRHIHSPEELALIISESRRGGLLAKREHDRLREALELTARTARELMIPRRRIEAVSINDPVDQILDRVSGSPFTRLPVFGESKDDVLGVLHTKDVAYRYVLQGRVDSIRPLLRPVVVVPETLAADQLLARLREERSHQAIVVDEFGGVEGLVTLEDVVAELLGQVSDEFKGVEPQPQELPDGRIRLPGATLLSDAERWTGIPWHLEDEEQGPDTAGGYVTMRLGHIPEAGEEITIAGARVQVEKVESHAVTSLLVTPPGGPPPGGPPPGGPPPGGPPLGGGPPGGPDGEEPSDE
ncbi:MAG: hemolysin family protein [Thermoleophilia bacterium]